MPVAEEISSALIPAACATIKRDNVNFSLFIVEYVALSRGGEESRGFSCDLRAASGVSYPEESAACALSAPRLSVRTASLERCATFRRIFALYFPAINACEISTFRSLKFSSFALVSVLYDFLRAMRLARSASGRFDVYLR